MNAVLWKVKHVKKRAKMRMNTDVSLKYRAGGFSEWIKLPLVKMFGWLVLRIFLYALLLGGIAYGTLLGAVCYGEVFFKEVGPVEISQVFFSLITALLFLAVGRIDRNRESLVLVLAGFFFCISVRESDYFLDILIGRHTWKVIVSAILILIALYIKKNGKRVVVSAIEFVNQPSFGVFLSGLLVLIVFSRLFGYGGFWKTIMDDASYRTVKTIVEEGVELMGCSLLLISACEYLCAVRKDRRCEVLKYASFVDGQEQGCPALKA